MNNKDFLKNDVRINKLVEKLKSKLNNFVVTDKQGELMGQVKDLILDTNRQLNLVVSRVNNERNYQFYLLLSKLIQKIDPPNKSVSVSMNKTEIEQLPEYVTNETTGKEMIENSSNSTNSAKAVEEITHSSDRSSTSESPQTLNVVDDIAQMEDSDNTKEWGEEIIRLLGERLIVDRSKQKVGEVIVRKQIETRMVEVPVRYEKLIVEQVSPEHKQLAEIDLQSGEISDIELLGAAANSEVNSLKGGLTVSGEFDSPRIATAILRAIAQERRHGCKKVRVEIVVEDTERQETYQEWFDRCSK